MQRQKVARSKDMRVGEVRGSRRARRSKARREQRERRQWRAEP